MVTQLSQGLLSQALMPALSLISAMLLLSGTGVARADVVPQADTTDNLSDPAFLPRQQQLGSTTSYTYSTFYRDWEPQGRAIAAHQEADGDHYGEILNYGITNRWIVGVDANYGTSSGEFIYVNRPPVDVSSSGLSNFDVHAYYEVITRQQSPTSLYVEAIYAPGLAHNAPRSEGLRLLLNRDFSLGSGGAMGLTLQGVLGASHDDDYAYTDSSSNTNAHLSGDWEYLAAARSQLRLSSRWAFNAGVQLVEDTSESVTPSGTSARYTNSSQATIEPYAAFAYTIVPRLASVALEYEHDFIGNQDRLGAGGNGTWIHQAQNLYSVRFFLLI